MRVFVTGATGFIGSAVVRELRSAGHAVLGLARNDERAADLTSAGVVAHRGDLSDVESLAAGARASDGAIHVAFDHGFGTTPRNVAAELDRRAIEAMAAVLEGKVLVVTSGTALLPPEQRRHGARRSRSNDAALEFRSCDACCSRPRRAVERDSTFSDRPRRG